MDDKKPFTKLSFSDLVSEELNFKLNEVTELNNSAKLKISLFIDNERYVIK
jgi:hypothetical protein